MLAELIRTLDRRLFLFYLFGLRNQYSYFGGFQCFYVCKFHRHAVSYGRIYYFSSFNVLTLLMLQFGTTQV